MPREHGGVDVPIDLRARHPDVDWSRVRLRRGLPWWARPGTRAMVLPRPRGLTIRVREDVDAASPAGRALLAHEAVHVAQAARGRWRWAARYLWLALWHGFGRAHPLEAPAYAAQGEERRRSRRQA